MKRGQPITNTSESAMKHSATERTRELATPKRVPSSYRPARSIEWPVKGTLEVERIVATEGTKSDVINHLGIQVWSNVLESTRKFETTEALKELSKPRDHKIKPSDTYYHGIPISDAALKTSPSNRLIELSAPLERKITKKYVYWSPITKLCEQWKRYPSQNTLSDIYSNKNALIQISVFQSAKYPNI